MSKQNDNPVIVVGEVAETQPQTDSTPVVKKKSLIRRKASDAITYIGEHKKGALALLGLTALVGGAGIYGYKKGSQTDDEATEPEQQLYFMLTPAEDELEDVPMPEDTTVA